jgi:hypothetical protein
MEIVGWKEVMLGRYHAGLASLGLLAAITLTGCAGTTKQASPEPQPDWFSDTQSSPIDVTPKVKEASGNLSSLIKSATETEPGRLVIKSTVVDPRGAMGSEPAQQAIKICEAVDKAFGYDSISVMENDGTTFVLYGHPMVPAGECGEV